MTAIIILSIICVFYLLAGLAKEGTRIDNIFKNEIEKRFKK